MRVFGIDPGSIRTGYGCIDTTGSRHTLVTCGALVMPTGASLPDRLHAIFSGLGALLADVRPDCVAVESVFHAANARSALVLGHARAAAILAELGFPLDPRMRVDRLPRSVGDEDAVGNPDRRQGEGEHPA